MLCRSLGVLAAGLCVAGPLAAQPAATLRPIVPPVAAAQSGDYTRQVSGPAAAFRTTTPVRTPAYADTPPPAAATPAPALVMPPVPAPTGGESCPVECAPDCPTCDCLCGPPGRVWLSAEWLYWTASGDPLPPLVTTAPPGTARAAAGPLGAPGTTVLAGGQRANDDFRNGFRVSGGVWLDPCQVIGVGANFFYLQPSHQGFAAASPGTAILTRPFTNALTGLPDAQLVSFPNVVAGAVGVDSTSKLIGGGGEFVRNLCCDPCGRLDLLLGYRYLNLRDELTVQENLVALPGASVPAGTRFGITDRFRTQNQFNGPVVGLNWERRFGYWFAGVRTTVAMGVSHEVVTINGSTAIAPPGGAASTFPGGLLTQPTNIGRYSSNRFAVVPDVGVRFGVQVTERARVFVGYDFLYWSSVVRAGDQIDLRVNPNQIAPPQPLNGPAVPAFTPRRTDYWVQGIGVGAEFRF